MRYGSILAAASKVFARKGQDDFSLAAVAREMKLHPVSLTYYFNKKEDLLTAVLLDAVERYEELLSIAQGAPTPPERLRKFIEAFFIARRRIAERGLPPLLDLTEFPERAEGQADVAQSSRQRAADHLAALLGDAEWPWMSAPRRALLSELTIGLLAWSDAWLWQYDPEDYPRAAAGLADLMLNGLSTEPFSFPEGQFADHPPGDTRDQLLAAATGLINQVGLRGASVDKIPARVGLTKGSLYHHLDSKDEIMAACAERTLDQVKDANLKASNLIDGIERVAMAMTTLASRQAKTGGEALLAPGTIWGEEGASAHRSRRVHLLRAVRSMSDVLLEGMRDGSIRQVDPNLAGHYLLSVAALARHASRSIKTSELGDDYLRPALQGFFID
ncbi:MAG: TetR/AcrR family transcriptional regulator [Phenylobacterium sp.]|jgi:AcrR family transcriptional regulator|nr:TetR/AcrR family transcriptional regulator [Phenylobacterium sp.]MBP7648285.1 TetR/AcrR family transcriptional regulator [Phenylobacterium sp.]MBP7814820.1 TetR/AcrR family transcriptional regulator [Phenylobacterium sp.]MBP9753363.1 TetR/AcrR family transcriptional regulator [Phenylobacterium sp.]MDP3593571.1 TetR/AcrR family transcriptional regulator [Phenylobacterium sp.]